MPADRRTRLVVAAGLIVILGLGLALRLVGLAYGLPAIYNPDEVAIMNRALAFATGDLNPHNFVYPTFYFYALFAWEALFFAVGRLFGLFDSLAAFQREFFVDPSRLFLAGRALTVALGVATAAAVYRFASRLFDVRTGLLAALFLAVAPIAVRDAHYVKHDVPVTLLIVLTMAVLARLTSDTARRRRTGAWLLAGALAGLAMSTHYYAVFVVVPVAVAALLAVPDPSEPLARRLRWLVVAGAAATIAFVAGSPFLVAEPATFLRDATANREIVIDRVTTDAGAFGSLGRYFEIVGAEAAGRVVPVLALVGAVMALAGNRRRALFLLAFPVPFLLFLANTFPASRYLNPLLPFLVVLAAYPLSWLTSWGIRGLGVAFVVAFAAAYDAGAESLRHGEFFRQIDTRTLALEYVERAIPPGSSILVQPYSVPLRPSREGLVEALKTHLGSESKASIKFQLQLALEPYPSPAYRTIYLGTGGLDVDKIYVAQDAFEPARSLAPLRALAVEYAILKRYNEPDPSLRALDNALTREGRLIASFAPYREEVPADRRAMVAPFLHNTDARIDRALARPGPTIEIWRIIQ
jgi:hypothetical protein